MGKRTPSRAEETLTLADPAIEWAKALIRRYVARGDALEDMRCSSLGMGGPGEPERYIQGSVIRVELYDLKPNGEVATTVLGRFRLEAVWKLVEAELAGQRVGVAQPSLFMAAESEASA